MRRLIREHGKCALTPEKRRSPFQSLVHGRRAPAAQRHGGEHDFDAVQKIVSRHENFRARKIWRTCTDEQIRACGFSFAKIKSIRDIAEKTLSGVDSDFAADREIVRRRNRRALTEVRGVGRWTVEMLLIFQLGRHDVLPADDFGVRTGFRHRLQKTRDAEAEGTARVRRKLESASHDGGVVSLARGGCAKKRTGVAQGKRSDARARDLRLNKISFGRKFPKL